MATMTSHGALIPQESEGDLEHWTPCPPGANVIYTYLLGCLLETRTLSGRQDTQGTLQRVGEMVGGPRQALGS